MKHLRIYINSAASQVPVLNWLYILSLPISYIAICLKLNPNSLTHLSNLFHYFSLYFLFSNNSIFFALLQFFSLLFDLCDGVVARATNQCSKIGAYYDHFSDIFKIMTLFLSIGIKFETNLVWILVFIIIFLFVFMHNISYLIEKNNVVKKEVSKPLCLFNGTKKANENKSKLRVFIIDLYHNFFSIYANFMLYFLLLGSSVRIVITTLAWILFVIIINLSRSLIQFKSLL